MGYDNSGLSSPTSDPAGALSSRPPKPGEPPEPGRLEAGRRHPVGAHSSRPAAPDEPAQPGRPDAGRGYGRPEAGDDIGDQRVSAWLTTNPHGWDEQAVRMQMGNDAALHVLSVPIHAARVADSLM